MAKESYISQINNTKIFAERAEYTKGGKNIDNMVEKVASATSGNLAAFDANGGLVDSNQAAANLVHDASYVHTDSNFTVAEKNKLNGIESGAQVNVIETVKVNGTTQTVTSKAIDISVPTAGTSNPNMDGTASAGSATTWSKSDHVHPTDTSREATANKDSSIPTSPVSGHYPSTEAVLQFVNSSISTNTANFLGTYDVVTDLGLTTSATNAQIASALNSYTFPAGTTVTNNDYVFVSINYSTTTDVDEYRRFKYSDASNGSWAYEYTLNNSSFTQAQWDAINSAITSTKVGNYDTHIANTNNPHGVTKAQVGLGNVGNFLAVSTAANQGLTDTQKVNARANIGAGTYSKPTNGIPSTDMESAVQTSLGLADTAYQKPSGGIPDSDIASASTWNGKQNALPTTGTASTTYAINVSGKATTAGTADSANSVAWSNVSSKPTKLSDFTDDITQQTYIASGTGSNKPASGTAVAQAVGAKEDLFIRNSGPSPYLVFGKNINDGIYDGQRFELVSSWGNNTYKIVGRLRFPPSSADNPLAGCTLSICSYPNTPSYEFYYKLDGTWLSIAIKLNYFGKSVVTVKPSDMPMAVESTFDTTGYTRLDSFPEVINMRDASWINSGTFDAARIPTSLPNVTAGRAMTVYDGMSAGMGHAVNCYGTLNTNNSMSGWYKIATVTRTSTSYSSARICGTIFTSGSNWANGKNFALHFQAIFNYTGDNVCIYHTPIEGISSIIRLVVTSTGVTELQVQPQAKGSWTNFQLYAWIDSGNATNTVFESTLSTTGSAGTVLNNYYIDTTYSGYGNGLGTSGQYLKSNGADNAPSWATFPTASTTTAGMVTYTTVEYDE